MTVCAGPYLARGGQGTAPPPVIVGKGALSASRCPYSDAKSAAAAAAAGCPSEPRTAPPRSSNFRLRTAVCVCGGGGGLNGTVWGRRSSTLTKDL